MEPKKGKEREKERGRKRTRWQRIKDSIITNRLMARMREKSPADKITAMGEKHIVKTPFRLSYPHSHQDEEHAINNPTVYLAVVKDADTKIMKIKMETDDTRGDQMGRIICTDPGCQPDQVDYSREAIFQQIDLDNPRDVVIPSGHGLVDSIVVFPDKGIKDQEMLLVRIDK